MLLYLYVLFFLSCMQNKNKKQKIKRNGWKLLFKIKKQQKKTKQLKL